jgi:uncharacterized protein (TIGR01777 family)
MNYEPLTMNNRNKHILLTGGTGVIGSHLTGQLLKRGYEVSHLSRSAGTGSRVKTYLWDVKKGEVDEHCIDGVNTIVHLAGAGVADKRWADKRKKLIIDSRVKSIGLIYDLLRSKKNDVNSVISASATGYYGDRGDELLMEESAPAHDFLGRCCAEWENAVDEGKSLGLRIVKFRTGVVLDKSGGALPKLAMPVKFGMGSPIGSGRQWISWIHWQDVVDLYMYAIENIVLEGTYNMAAPNPVTNKQLTQAIAGQLHKPFWLPNVPTFILKLLLGEMSAIVLGSTKVSAQKIEDAGYTFKYPEITSALREIYE